MARKQFGEHHKSECLNHQAAFASWINQCLDLGISVEGCTKDGQPVAGSWRYVEEVVGYSERGFNCKTRDKFEVSELFHLQTTRSQEPVRYLVWQTPPKDTKDPAFSFGYLENAIETALIDINNVARNKGAECRLFEVSREIELIRKPITIYEYVVKD